MLANHYMHQDEPNKTWKSDGDFYGVVHAAGEAKPDKIFEALVAPGYKPDDFLPKCVDGLDGTRTSVRSHA